MNLVDILIWVVLLSFAVKGFMKGLVKEVCSLLGLFAGGWIAFAYYGHVAAALGPHIHLPRFLLPVLSFGLIFVTLGLSFFFLGHLLTTFFKIILLGAVNRLAGLVLGLLEGALLVSIVLGLAVSAPAPEKLKKHVGGAAMAKPFVACGTGLISLWKPPGEERKEMPPGSKRPVHGGRHRGPGTASLRVT